MTIDKVSRIHNLYKSNGKNKVNQTGNVSKRDSINISSEAKQKAEIEHYIKIVNEAPDIREEKVAQAKENLARYRSDAALFDKVIENIASRLSNLIS